MGHYRLPRRLGLITLAVLVVSVASPLVLRVPTPRAQAAQIQVPETTQLAAGLLALNDFATASQAALAIGDVAAARAAYTLFDNGWEDIEDGVRARSRDSYRDIENAMRDAFQALNANPVDPVRASALLDELQNRVRAFVATLPVS